MKRLTTSELMVEQSIGKFLARAADRDGGRERRRKLISRLDENQEPTVNG